MVANLSQRVLLLCLALLVTACAIRPYQNEGLAGAAFLQRAVVQTSGPITVRAAVPDREETTAITGLDLYDQGIQPVWLEVVNKGTDPARIANWSIDRDYFSPIEVAYMNRKQFNRGSYPEMERWFHASGLPRFVPAGETRSGLVYTHHRPGTKGFNLNVFSGGELHDLTFFVPLPGFVADFMEVDFQALYTEEDSKELTLGQLRRVLEQELPCCATDLAGELEGGPFNAVLVGTGTALRRALLRGDWVETAAGELDRARQQSFRGRQPDGIFTKSRPDGNERIHLHLWLAPWRVGGEPVWLGQVYYWAGDDSFFARIARDSDLADFRFTQFFARESVIADLDGAQRFLLQNLWYNGSLLKAGYTGGIGVATVEEPRTTFGGSAYYTEGNRLVLVLSEQVVGLDEGEWIFDTLDSEKKQPLLLPGGRTVPPPNDRVYSREEGSLVVSTAVPSRQETREVFKLDLYAKNVQPVWVRVENRSKNTLLLTPMGLDPGYFTARETANRSRPEGRDVHAPVIERQAMVQLEIPPESTRSGYLFTRVDEGTKSFNVDVLGDGQPRMMTFFVPVPGLKLDHYEVDIPGMYPDSELRHVNLPELVAAVEALPCCVRDAKGVDRGDPLNLVFVADILDLYYAFMRAGWDETETIYRSSLLKTAASALTGNRYRYSPVSALYVFGRAQDAAMQRARSSIHERNHLRIWLTPLRYQGKPVWIGQISRDIGVHLTWRTITTHKIDPDVDETREFLLEDMAYAQALEAFGYVGGVGPASYDQPRGNLTGDPYFTDGRRVIMWIASEQTGMDEIKVMDLSPYLTGVVSD